MDRGRWTAAAAGVAAAAAGAGVGELTAAIVAPASSPFAVVGGALIDAAPAWAKDTAIALFGTGDKAALLVGIAVVVALVAAAAGVLERRWRWAGRALALAAGLAGAILAATRADAQTLAWLPAVLAGVAAALALRGLVRPSPRPDEDAADAPSRRAVLVWTAATAAAGVLAAVGGTLLRAGARVATAARDAVRLPAAVSTAVVPASAELGIAGLAPVVTPNGDFYRIDTALVVPELDPAAWTLRVHGLVDEEIVLTWDELLALPLSESVTTLTCVSNEVGGDLIGNAVWLGYPLREILARARPHADADMVLSTSADGFTAGTPLEALTDDRDAILAVGMNGEPLPLAHGFPVRMVVPGLYGYVSATKWVVDLEVTRFTDRTAYWTSRGWSAQGPVKLASRIDVPRGNARIPSGDAVIAGVAWQQHTGVGGVEVQVDDGPWRTASLATAISDDTWVQWSLPWQADAGDHVVRCRATSATGEVQTAALAPPAPDGATGWHEVRVSVA